LMLKPGNSTAEESSAIAENLWTTVSCWSEPTELTGLLKTHGEPAGEILDTSLWLEETPAVLPTLLLPLNDQIIKIKNIKKN